MPNGNFNSYVKPALRVFRVTLMSLLINPLTTDDTIWRRQFLAACYQLVQSVLKIGSALAERVGQGEVGGYTALADITWRLLQLPVEKPWSMPGGPFVCLLAQAGIEMLLSPCTDSISGLLGSF